MLCTRCVTIVLISLLISVYLRLVLLVTTAGTAGVSVFLVFFAEAGLGDSAATLTALMDLTDLRTGEADLRARDLALRTGDLALTDSFSANFSLVFSTRFFSFDFSVFEFLVP